MKTILIPVFHERVSSRLDCTEYFQLVKIESQEIISTEKIRIIANNYLEKINYILSIKPDIIICNGITELCQDKFAEHSIRVIPWIHGQFLEVIVNFLNGNYETVI
jgi:predicted Fe-Mo cluster-binding NifX family protein